MNTVDLFIKHANNNSKTKKMNLTSFTSEIDK